MPKLRPHLHHRPLLHSNNMYRTPHLHLHNNSHNHRHRLRRNSRPVRRHHRHNNRQCRPASTRCNLNTVYPDHHSILAHLLHQITCRNICNSNNNRIHTLIKCIHTANRRIIWLRPILRTTLNGKVSNSIKTVVL